MAGETPALLKKITPTKSKFPFDLVMLSEAMTP
jgi:hypothetical protein